MSEVSTAPAALEADITIANAASTSPGERLLRFLGYARLESSDFIGDYYMWGNILNVIGSLGYLACDLSRGVSATDYSRFVISVGHTFIAFH